MSARIAVAAALAVFAIAPGAAAFCRTTTCDPRDPTQACTIDPQTLCVTSGIPLHWPTACVSFGVQADGSLLRNIDYTTADSVISRAYEAWLGAGCGNNAFPAITIGDRGRITCNHPEYNQNDGNANVWMFRDDAWPYPDGADSTIALTTVTYNTENGEIYDADVEINSKNTDITVGDTNVQFDLQSIATHEAGHFFGLSHTLVPGSTMLFSYRSGDTTLRTLGTDDIEAICAAYPPGRVAPGTDCTPRHGFSSQCASPHSNCSLVAGSVGSRNSTALLAVGSFAFGALGRRRNRARRDG